MEERGGGIKEREERRWRSRGGDKREGGEEMEERGGG